MGSGAEHGEERSGERQDDERGHQDRRIRSSDQVEHRLVNTEPDAARTFDTLTSLIAVLADAVPGTSPTKPITATTSGLGHSRASARRRGGPNPPPTSSSSNELPSSRTGPCRQPAKRVAMTPSQPLGQRRDLLPGNLREDVEVGVAVGVADRHDGELPGVAEPAHAQRHVRRRHISK